MFELLNRYKPTQVLELPQHQDSAMALSVWRHQLVRFKEMVEELTGISITNQRLQDAIAVMNRQRRA